MDDYRKYEELRNFLGSELWKEELRPMIERWAGAKESRIRTAETPADLWDARTAATTAGEVLPMIDSSLDELRRRLRDELDPDRRAATST